MDHGTTAVSFNIIDENKKQHAYFKLNRDKLSNNEVSFKDTLSEYVNYRDIDMLAITYAMGDDLTKITPIEKAKNRGIKSLDGAGLVTGGGSKVYDEILELEIPSVLIPGLHRLSPFMDKRFRALYSHCASSEKVSLSYCACKEYNLENMIIADISSNTVSILIEDSVIKGALDACIGACGFIHGPLDLEMIRNIDSGKKTANECFSHAGISKIAHIDTKINNVKDNIIKKAVDGDEKAVLAIESLVMSVVMEIYSLYGASKNDIDAIILTGSGGVMKKPIDINRKIRKKVEKIAPVYTMSDRSGAIGSSLIAYDIAVNNKKNILGIDVDC